MEMETVVKIEEDYSVKYFDENDNGDGQAQSYEIKPVVSIPPVPFLPEPCDFQKDDSRSPTAITFYSGNSTVSNCKRIKNAGESPLANTKDLKGGSSRKEEASAEEKYKCSIPNCSKSFAIKRKLNVHLKYDHRQNWFKCHLCGSAFAKHAVFKSHLAKHFNGQPYACSICSTSFKHIEYLWKHEQEIHQITQRATKISRVEKQPPFQSCELAKISVSFEAVPSEDVTQYSESSTEKSSELVTNEPDPLEQPEKTKIVKKDRRQEESLAEKKYKCFIPNCSKSLSNKWTLQAHLTKKHKQNWLFKCSLCGKLCSNKSALENHLFTHSTARPHNCNVCTKSYKYIKDLLRHDQKVHQISSSSTKNRELGQHQPDLTTQAKISIPTSTLSLPDSTTDTDTEAELVLVDPTTAPQAPLLKSYHTNKCSVCLKVFKTRLLLGNHRRHVHAAQNEKRYKCHVCPKSFVVRPQLKRHLYFVHGEKSEDLKIFQCEFCKREFPSASPLKAHIVDQHVVDKEFECLVCSKTFVGQDALTKHQVKVHEHTTKSHFCDVCLAGFTSKGNLANHVKTSHKRLKCHKCGRSFANKSEFDQHLNSGATIYLQAGLILKCQVCFVSLSTQCNFNIHTDSHSRQMESAVVT